MLSRNPRWAHSQLLAIGRSRTLQTSTRLQNQARNKLDNSQESLGTKNQNNLGSRVNKTPTDLASQNDSLRPPPPQAQPISSPRAFLPMRGFPGARRGHFPPHQVGRGPNQSYSVPNALLLDSGHIQGPSQPPNVAPRPAQTSFFQPPHFPHHPSLPSGPGFPPLPQADQSHPAFSQSIRPSYARHPMPSYPLTHTVSPQNQNYQISERTARGPTTSPIPLNNGAYNSEFSPRHRNSGSAPSPHPFNFDILDLTGSGVPHRFSGNHDPRDSPSKFHQPNFPGQQPLRYDQAATYPRSDFNGLRDTQSALDKRRPFDGQPPYPTGQFGQIGKPFSQRDKPLSGRNRPSTQSRGRGRVNSVRDPRGRTRGLLSSQFPESSLPPPPSSVLDENGGFGPELVTLGYPTNTSILLHAGSSPTDPDSFSKGFSDYMSLQSVIRTSDSPIRLPGFAKPLPLPAIQHEEQVATNLEINHRAGEASKKDVLDRAVSLVCRNASMDTENKRKTLAVVDFLLMSREQRAAIMK